MGFRVVGGKVVADEPNAFADISKEANIKVQESVERNKEFNKVVSQYQPTIPSIYDKIRQVLKSKGMDSQQVEQAMAEIVAIVSERIKTLEELNSYIGPNG